MGILQSTPVSDVSGLEAERSLLRKKRAARLRQAWMALLFLAPAALFLLVFVYLPSFVALAIAFFHYHLGGASSPYIGITNFSDALQFNIFQKSLLNTGYYALLMVPSILIVSVCLALLLNRVGTYYNFLRTLVLLPYATPAVGTAIGWLWIFNPTYGLANGFLHWLGLPVSGWLQSPRMAMPSIAIYSLWHGVGFDVIIVLAAIAGLPKQMLEAAAVDGASAWKRFWKVTLPLISPTMFFILIITTIGTLQSFSQIYALSGGTGGPEYSTMTTLLLIYDTAFKYSHLSYGSAMAILMVIVIIVLTLTQRYASKRFVFYQ
ncbi:MAG: sugar ABC transporter permease [Alicyclobacillaceae bacterium]|nr:sugar ABC transporter permease [Alicyclobacillaceae bacterium]